MLIVGPGYPLGLQLEVLWQAQQRMGLLVRCQPERTAVWNVGWEAVVADHL
jgi:hypothetical protein